MEDGRLRLFFGLPLPPDLGEALGRWQRGQPDLGGWTRPEGLHLTLAFVGERPPEALPALALAASVVARHRDAFELHTAGLGGFPNDRATRVLWLGLEPTLDLAALAADLRGALEAQGEAFDPKPFRPHLTLARFRRARPVAAFAAPPPAPFTADRLVLFESRPQGRYTPLRTWPLRGV